MANATFTLSISSGLVLMPISSNAVSIFVAMPITSALAIAALPVSSAT
jgi:hypothetical protein